VKRKINKVKNGKRYERTKKGKRERKRRNTMIKG